MKKVISKILIIFIIIVILFEFVGSSNISYAFDSEDINAITNLIGGIVSFVLWIPRLLVTSMAWVAGDALTTGLAESCGINDDIEVFKGTLHECATPFDIFFNKYKLFDVNFFDISSEKTIINSIRTQVAQWFYTFRLVAAAILLAVLIYVGIRMAISTVADEKAKYKKMLFDWCCSLALVFVLQYIAIFTIYANNALVDALRSAGYNDIDAAIDSIFEMARGPMGIGALVATFVYCMIIFQTIAFMLTYIQRMLKVGFLLIISPLISITYSIDKIGDGKAQALNTWLKEFVYTILIQPFHCIMYLAFVNTAMRLLSTGATISDILNEGFWEAIGNMNQITNGVLAILCLKFINDGEKAIRKIFNFQDDGNLTSMAAGAMVGMAAIRNAKKIGASTAKGINMAKGGVAKFGNAISNDKMNEKLKNTKIGQGLHKLDNGAKKISNAIGNKVQGLSDGFKGTKFAKGLDKFGKGISTGIDKAGNAIGNAINKSRILKNGAKTIGKGAKFVGEKGKKVAQFAQRNTGKVLKRSMPLALGMMGAAMSYATGTSGAMEAIGVGSGLHKGSEQFFESTTGTIAGEKAELAEFAANAAYEEQEFDMDTTDDAIRAKENELGMDDSTRLSGSAIQAVALDPNKKAQWQAKLAEKTLPEPPELKEGESDSPEAQQMRSAKQKQDTEKELARLYLHRGNLGERKTKEDFRKAYLDAGNIDGLSRTASHKTEDIQAKKNALLQKILELKASRKREDGQEDNNSTNILSEKDVSSGERAMKSITDSIDRSLVGAGVTRDLSKIIQRDLGLEDDTSPEYQAIMRAALDYRKTTIAASAEKIDNKAAQVGISDDAYSKATHRRVYGSTKQ